MPPFSYAPRSHKYYNFQATDIVYNLGYRLYPDERFATNLAVMKSK